VLFIGWNGWFIAVGGALIGSHVLTPAAESWLSALIVGSKFLEGYISQGIARLKKEISDSKSGDTSIWKLATSMEPPKPPDKTK
jgi:hypothetical protein